MRCDCFVSPAKCATMTESKRGQTANRSPGEGKHKMAAVAKHGSPLPHPLRPSFPRCTPAYPHYLTTYAPTALGRRTETDASVEPLFLCHWGHVPNELSAGLSVCF